MKIKYNALDEIDEGMRETFVPWKDGDKEIFVHKDYAEDMREHFRLKGDHTELKNKFDESQSRLDELSNAESARRRKEEAEDLDAKKKGGKFDEIISDWETKYQSKEQEIADLRKERLQDKKTTVVQRLANLGTDNSRTKLARLIDQDLSFDDNGSIIVLNTEGKATSQSVEEYESKLRDLYPELVKEVQSNGGQGNGGYNSGAGGSKTIKRTEFEKLNHGSRAKFFKDGGKLTD
jgi:hypothetical protein